MPLVRVTRVNVKGIEKELRRLNDLLTLYLANVCGLTIPGEAPASDESQVLYSDDESTYRRELEDVVARRNPERHVEADE